MKENEDASNLKRPPRPPPPDRATVPKRPSPPPSVKHHLEELQCLKRGKVRWFYKEEKKWVPFNGADSLEIERAYQEAHGKEINVDFQQENQPKVEILILPTVRGRLYEVDIIKKECTAIYWKDDPVPVLRGTWFKGAALQEHWEPLEEKEAEKIEEIHQNVVRSLGVGSLGTVDSENTVIYQQKTGHGYRVEWHDISEVYLVSESTGSKLAQKIGLGGPTRLHRGYHTQADPCDCPAEINHVVFLVHGIGQLINYTGGIIYSCKKFREAANKAMKKHFKDNLSDERVEFFPVEWRSSLKLDEGIIDAITPNNIGGIRKILNETTMDVMYYTSPFFREEIVRSLREQMNNVYMKYCDRNPSFLAKNGKVSVMAHSLGSVIFHDILINWNSQILEKRPQCADQNVAIEGRFSWIWGMGTKSREPVESSEDDAEIHRLGDELRKAKLKVHDLEASLHTPLSKHEGISTDKIYDYSLNFKVENVFNIGSPLGVFLVMKGIRPRVDLEQRILPASVCKNYYNIFDPTDPVAYRLEPLIYEHYADIPPMKIAKLARSADDKKEVRKASGSSGWIKSWFTGKTTQDNSVEFQAEGKVDLPKSEDEKTEEILKTRKAIRTSGGIMYWSPTSFLVRCSCDEFGRFRPDILTQLRLSPSFPREASVDSWFCYRSSKFSI